MQHGFARKYDVPTRSAICFRLAVPESRMIEINAFLSASVCGGRCFRRSCNRDYKVESAADVRC
jgi:hypothetical protein